MPSLRSRRYWRPYAAWLFGVGIHRRCSQEHQSCCRRGATGECGEPPHLRVRRNVQQDTELGAWRTGHGRRRQGIRSANALRPMTNVEKLVDRYCEGWSASTPTERERILRSVLHGDARYCDPRCEPLPLEALLRHIDKVHATRPGARVLRTSAVDMHHGHARFQWHVRLPDGRSLPESLDIVELTDDHNHILRITGFFGPLPPRSHDVSHGHEPK